MRDAILLIGQDDEFGGKYNYTIAATMIARRYKYTDYFMKSSVRNQIMKSKARG